MNIFDAQISGSLIVSGTAQITGDLTVSGTLFADISGTSENAVSAAYAGNYTLTSSFEDFTGSYNTGSFTGSFTGDGSGLNNIPASGVTGLNLTQIANGSATASISQTNGLRVNTNAELTGSLKISNINLGTDKVIVINVTDAGGKYFIDGVRNPVLSLIKGFTYKFLYPNMGSHPFRFSTTNDGTHNGGTTYSVGVTTGSTPSYIQIEVTDATPTTLYYYCTAHIGMGNAMSVYSDLLNVEADRQLVYIEPSTIATTGSNNFIGAESISGSLSVTGSVDITGSMSLNGQPIGTGKLDETIFSSYTASNNLRVNAIEVSTGSLNTFTNSINTTIKTKMNSDGVISGSAQVNIADTTGYSTFSSSISQSLLNSKNYTDSAISTLASTVANVTEFNNFTSSADARLDSLEVSAANLNSYTSSNTTNINAIHSVTASINSFSSSVLGAIEITGSNLTVKGDLLVKGTTTQINSTTLNIGDNIISLNGTATTNGGIQVQDATGLSATSGSLLWDSALDYWKAGKLGSEEKIILSGEYNSLSTSIDNNLTSLQSTNSSLNSYTSSNDTNISAIHTATSSLNNFTSSTAGRLTAIETTSGSLNTYTSSTNTRLGVIESTTGSLNSYTSSTDVRISSIETSTGSLNTFSSSANTRLGVIEATTSSLNTYTSSTNDRISYLEIASGNIRSDFNTFTSSNSSTTTTQNNRLGALEISTSSLNTYTSSTNTRLGLIESTTGSLNTYTSSTNSRLSAIETSTGSLNTFSSSIRSDFNSYTTSNDSRLNSLEIASGAVNTYTSSNTSNILAIHTATSSLNSYTSSTNTRLGLIESTTSSLNSYTSSNNTNVNAIHTATSSLNSFTSSINTTIKNKLNSDNVISGSGQVILSSTNGYTSFSSSLATTDAGQDTRLTSLEGVTGSYATTGSNVFQGNQTITGSLYVSENLVVRGSSSINFVSQSTLNIGTNLITVNAHNPSERFGGLAVIDSGSSPTVSGSILFDSINNQWIVIHHDQGVITSSVVLMGPQTFNSPGNETYPTPNKILKSLSSEHVGDSNITDNGTKVSINSNTEVTGTIISTGNISSPNITAIQGATGSLNTFTSSLLSAIELTGSNLTVKGNLVVKGTTTNVNTTNLDVDNNLINLNGSGATFAGLRVKDTTGPNQVSGSLLWDSINDYWVAGQLGSEQRLVRETEFNTQVSRIGSIETTTGSLNTYTSSTNTRLGVIETATSSLNSYTTSTNTRLVGIETSTASLNTYTSSTNTRLNSLETASGSIRSDFNSFTSSNNTIETTQNNRLTSLETTTSSLNTYTSSNTTSITAIHTATSSLNSFTSSAGGRLSSIEGVTGSIGSLNTYTGSINTVIGTLQTSTSSLNTYTSSNNTNIAAIHTATSSLNSYTSSTNTRLGVIESATSSLNTFTASATTRLGSLETSTGSLNTYTSSTNTKLGVIESTTSSLNTFTSSASTRLGSLETASGSIRTDFNTYTSSINTFSSSVATAIELTGSNLTVKGNLLIKGTTTTVNSTTIDIADNIIQLNGAGTTNGGLVVRDATAPNSVSGSLLWDTTNDKWIAGALGAEDDVVLRTATQTLTNKTISGGSNTLTNIANSSLTNSTITIAGTSTALGGSITAATILSGTNVWSGSAQLPSGVISGSAQVVASLPAGTVSGSSQISYGGISNIPAGIVSGSAQITFGSISSIPSGLVSGSAQISISGTNGFGTYLNQAVLTSSSPTFVGLTATSGTQTATLNYNTAAGLALFKSDIAAAGTYTLTVGKAASLNNTANFRYQHAGDGSTSNFVGIGFWSNDDLFKVYANGNVMLGTITSGAWNGSVIGSSYGGAGTVNGIMKANGSGTVSAAVAGTDYVTPSATFFIGTTSIAHNRASASQTLTGVSIDGNAATVTNGVYTSSAYTDPSWIIQLAGSKISGNINGQAGSVLGLTLNSLANAANPDTVTQNQIGYNTNVSLFSQTDGGLYSSAYSSNWIHQIFGDFRTGQVAVRGKNSGTWQSWRVLLDSTNVNTYTAFNSTFTNVSTVTVTHNFGTKNVGVFVYDTNDDMFWPSNIKTTDTNTVTVTFASNRSGRVVVLR